ncbi:hypothetical protein, partial [Streptomyces sp. NRRL F-2664]|uniref:hypothetical protein n=1 Tax=Streptomyces sp. NRRL F-2664 TaxID=1463842 RepID=UPI0005BAF125
RGDLATRTDTRPNSGSGEGGQEDAGTDGSGDTGAAKGAAAGAPVTTHTVHGYDAYNRLASTTVHNGPDAKAPVLRSTAYTANAAGDVTATTATGADGSKTATAHETDPAGRLTAVAADGQKTEQGWDTAGNLLKGADGTTWTYNPDNKPLTATTADGLHSTYTYWA